MATTVQITTANSPSHTSVQNSMAPVIPPLIAQTATKQHQPPQHDQHQSRSGDSGDDDAERAQHQLAEDQRGRH